ncbi:hypothetical protein [Aeromonas caviae]|uniref:hypothetical protein n=1 Tax=Aeromonas caviae TaxID=648 RepID=UPI002B48E77E|nr:hypothetical protein [Aeromonas caviae]
MMEIIRKINIASNKLSELKTEIKLLSFKMDLLRERYDVDSASVEKEFDFLIKQFNFLRKKNDKFIDVAHEIILSAKKMAEEEQTLARGLQDISDQCRTEYDKMNSAMVKFCIKHFKN